MKKRLFLLSLLFIPAFCLGVQGEVAEGFEYKEPQSKKEAQEIWKKAQEDRKALEEEFKEKERQWKYAQINLEGIKSGTPEYKELQEQLSKATKEMSDAVEKKLALEEQINKLAQNQYIKQMEEFGKQFEPAIEKPEEKFEEPGWWKSIQQRVTAWFKETQAKWYDWLGDKNAVIRVRQDLTNIYASLGKGGLLEHARNNKELAKAFDDLSAKIAKNLEALDRYQIAKKVGDLSPAHVAQTKAEVKNVVEELLILEKQLEESKVDQQTREIIQSYIDDVLKQFGLNEEEVKGYQAQYERRVTRQIDSTEETLQEKIKEYIKNPLGMLEPYLKDIETYINELKNLKDLTPFQEAQIKTIIYQAYRDSADNILADIGAEKYGEQTNELVSDWIELDSQANKAYEDYIQAFNAFVEQEGREPSQAEIGVAEPLTEADVNNLKETLEKNIKPLINHLESLRAKRTVDFATAYDELKRIIQQRLSSIEQSAVSVESIQARRAIDATYTNVLDVWLDNVSKQPVLQQDEYISTIEDILELRRQLREKIDLDKSILVIIATDGKGELVKEHARPDDDQKYLEQLQKIKGSIPADLSAQQEFLYQTKTKPIEEEKKLTSEQRKKLMRYFRALKGGRAGQGSVPPQ